MIKLIKMKKRKIEREKGVFSLPSSDEKVSPFATSSCWYIFTSSQNVACNDRIINFRDSSVLIAPVQSRLEIAWWNSSSLTCFLPPANYEITQERSALPSSSLVLLFHLLERYLSANYARHLLFILLIISVLVLLFLLSCDRPHPSWPFSPRRCGVKKLTRLMAQPCFVTFVTFTGYFGYRPMGYANWFAI